MALNIQADILKDSISKHLSALKEREGYTLGAQVAIPISNELVQPATAQPAEEIPAIPELNATVSEPALIQSNLIADKVLPIADEIAEPLDLSSFGFTEEELPVVKSTPINPIQGATNEGVAFMSKIRQMLNVDEKTLEKPEDIATTIEYLNNEVNQKTFEIEELKKNSGALDVLTDPYISELVNLRKNGAGPQQLAALLNYLSTDYMETDPNTRQYVISDDNIIRQALTIEGIPQEEIEEELESYATPVQKRLAAKGYRMQLNQGNTERLAKFKEEQLKAKEKIDLEYNAKEARQKQKEAEINKRIKEVAEKLNKVGNVEIPEPLRAPMLNRFKKDVDSNKFIENIFLDENGLPKSELMFELWAKYSNSVPEQTRAHFDKKARVNEKTLTDNIKKEIFKANSALSTDNGSRPEQAGAPTFTLEQFQQKFAGKNGVGIKLGEKIIK